MAFKDRLKEAREQAGLNQTELAELLGNVTFLVTKMEIVFQKQKFYIKCLMFYILLQIFCSKML